jgi:protein-S-isoprenylcysteine O-methyltransferase Ste14
MLPPLLAVIGVIVAFSLSFFCFYSNLLPHTTFFFLPILMLIAYHTLIMQFITKTTAVRTDWWTVGKKVLGKFVFWLVLMAGLYAVYANHPFYVHFAPHTKLMLAFFIKLYLILGIPYFILVERFRTARFDWFNDAYLKFLSFCRSVWRRRWQTIRYRVLKRGYKSLLLSWLVRLHFIPVMVEQVYWGASQTMNFLSRPEQAFATALFFVGLLFLVDSINASMGYFWESTLTKTRFRAIDTNAFHWIVVLMCYMPFISYASNFVPFPKGSGALIIAAPVFEWMINALTIASLLGIVLTTTCLGFSYSNLSYKKIQTRGPYAIVRHPGTVFKIVFFFLTVFRFEAAYSIPIIAAYIFWMGVYVVRILCEERFLLHFREYQDYVKQTRYRLIPGVW